jgi:hypothetical protein
MNMSTLHIRLPDKLMPKLTARATESGFDTAEAYIEALVRAEAGHVELVSDDDLEDLLAKRLENGDTIEFTPAFARKFKKEIAQRRRARKSKA